MLAIFYLGVPLLTSGRAFRSKSSVRQKAPLWAFRCNPSRGKKPCFVILNVVKNLKQPSPAFIPVETGIHSFKNKKAELQTPLSGVIFPNNLHPSTISY